jgi:hypothetical protein
VLAKWRITGGRPKSALQAVEAILSAGQPSRPNAPCCPLRVPSRARRGSTALGGKFQLIVVKGTKFLSYLIFAA